MTLEARDHAVRGSLITIFLVLGIGRTADRGPSRWLIDAPIQLYLGWITVTSTLDHLDWKGLGLADETRAVVMSTVCAALSLAMCVTRRDATRNTLLARDVDDVPRMGGIGLQ